MNSTSPSKNKKRRRLEKLARQHTGSGILDQAKTAAGAEMAGKLVGEHPLIAAELVLAGAVRGISVAVQEMGHRIGLGINNEQTKTLDKEQAP